jgi:hypothetical protein
MLAGNREKALRTWNHISLIACLFFSASVFAAQITGTATNGTTNKPAAGDDVVLLSLGAGMDEVGRTKTDSQGHFTIDVPDNGGQHLIQVVHGGVNYNHHPAPGATTVDIMVYDSAKQVGSISIDGRIFRLQTASGQLEVFETYTVQNASIPPRTKMADRTFEIAIPEGAQLSDASVTGPGGLPTATTPERIGNKNRYAFVYPIRPGKSQFQVFYKLPYSGSYEFTVAPEMPVAELGVLLPKSMQLNFAGERFAQDSDESGMNVFFVKSVAAGQKVKFSISGEGLAPVEGQQNSGGSTPANPGAAGTPINTDQTSAARWYIFGAILVIVAGGVFWMVQRRTPGASRASSSTAKPERPQRSPQPVPEHNTMLDALKDELFQLETDRMNGKISQKDYEAAKAGLDALLRRQMKT